MMHRLVNWPFPGRPATNGFIFGMILILVFGAPFAALVWWLS